MKNVHGWWLPDSETHMVEMLEKGFKKSGVYEYQKETRDLALKYCKDFEMAYDVGAHIGFWSKDLATKFQRVFSFEPMYEFRECFVRNNQCKNVDLWDFALGEEETHMSIDFNPENTGNTHLSLEKRNYEVPEQGDMDEEEWLKECRRIWKANPSTKVLPLDQFNIEHFSDMKLSFMKIDVEGYEIFVLKGAKETIKKHKPVIVIEQKPHDFYGLPRYAARDYCVKELGMTVLNHKRDDYILGYR